MSKKRINKIKSKQKQKQKQSQVVNVHIHKPSRKPREGPSQPKRSVLPTPQYIYTSQTDNLVPQMFNKEGKQEAMPSLSEQINKSLDEKINKLASQYNKPVQQPTLEEVRIARDDEFNKPIPIYKKEPETLKNILIKKEDVPPIKNKNKETLKEDSMIYNPKEKIKENINLNMPVEEIPIQFQKQKEPQLNDLQMVAYKQKKTDVPNINPELLNQFIKNNMSSLPKQMKYDQPIYNGPLLSGGENINLIDKRIVKYEKKPKQMQLITEEQQAINELKNERENILGKYLKEKAILQEKYKTRSKGEKGHITRKIKVIDIKINSLK